MSIATDNVKKNRSGRLIAGMLLPVLVGAVLLLAVFVAGFVSDWLDKGGMVSVSPDLARLPAFVMGTFIILLGAGYVILGIPSILFSFLAEFYMNPLIKNNSLFYLACAGAGVLSGALAGLVLIGVLPMAGAGLVPGLVTGLFLRKSWLASAQDSET